MCIMALILSSLLQFLSHILSSPKLWPFAPRMLAKVSARSAIGVVFFFPFHYNVINVSKKISLHLIYEDGFHHPTECWASILEALGHLKITIGAEGCDEDCLSFILFAEPDLVVPREII
jgi:hypothetical protein